MNAAVPPSGEPGHEHRRVLVHAAAWAGLLVLLLGIFLTAAAFTFSVSVSGHSMEPTLREGDRLIWDVFQRHDIKRFSIVEAITPDINKTRVVKRVIGLPGDRLAIPAFTSTPTILLRPAGASVTYELRSATWSSQIGSAYGRCCTASGTGSSQTRWVTVPSHEYFVIGDNWGGSTDSRTYGFVSTIGGKLGFRVTPLGRFGPVPNPVTMTPVTARIPTD